MNRYSVVCSLCLIVLTVCAGCDNTFSPKTEFQEELVVYAVLDNALDMQVVRLNTTYDAELGNLEAYSGRQIDSAHVEIRESSNLYVFHDTTITLSDGTTEKMWINRDLKPKPNKQYRLKVLADDFDEATSAFTLPSASQVRITVRHTSLSIDSVVVASGALNYVVEPKGFYIRLVLEYRDTLDGDIIYKTAEVPIDEESSTGMPIYSDVGREDIQGFPKAQVVSTLYSLTTDKTRFDRVGAIAYMYTVGEQFYNYFKLVRGFDDPNSVRLDEPDYTNVTGARGVFGGVYRDTAYTALFKFYRP